MSSAFRAEGGLAAVGLVLASPLLLMLALLVLVSMGRPILFRQMRSGKDGRTFKMLKFRSMRDLNDRQGNPLPDEQRVTAVGRFLRRSRLDELPELINILRGDMAFVGPRPLLPHTIAALGEAGRQRGFVRPGLTGLAQVSGNTLLTVEEKLRYDLWYVRNRSLALDAQILMHTVRVVFKGERRIVWHADEARPPYWGG